MIDPESQDTPLGNPPHHQLVSRVEHALVLDPETDERVDIEEAAVAKIARGHSPIGDAIVLLLEKFVQSIRIGVQLRDDFVNRARRHRVLVQQLGEHVCQQLLVAMPSRDAREIGRGRRWQCVESVREKRQRIASAFLRRRRENLPQ